MCHAAKAGETEAIGTVRVSAIFSESSFFLNARVYEQLRLNTFLNKCRLSCHALGCRRKKGTADKRSRKAEKGRQGSHSEGTFSLPFSCKHSVHNGAISKLKALNTKSYSVNVRRRKKGRNHETERNAMGARRNAKEKAFSPTREKHIFRSFASFYGLNFFPSLQLVQLIKKSFFASVSYSLFFLSLRDWQGRAGKKFSPSQAEYRDVGRAARRS